MSLFQDHVLISPWTNTIVNPATPSYNTHMEMGGNACVLWKNSRLCIIHLIVPWFSFPVWIKKGRNSRFSCVTLPDENISRCSPRLSFFRGLVKQKTHSCRFYSICFVLRVVKFRGTEHAVKKVTNCFKYPSKYAVTHTLQFNFSGPVLIRPQAAFMLLSSFYIS